jgi:hypothetical protein
VAVTVERINLYQNIAKAFRRKYEFDQMREVPFVRKPDELAFATGHLPARYCQIIKIELSRRGHRTTVLGQVLCPLLQPLGISCRMPHWG